MNLYIRIKDGVPFEHPIFEQNLKDAFPDVDTNNLTSDFARFVRVEQPIVSVYEVAELVYGWDGDVVKDIWNVRSMTEEEKQQKQNDVKNKWSATGYVSWIFNETTCSFESPIPLPNDGKMYLWDEATTSWVEAQQ